MQLTSQTMMIHPKNKDYTILQIIPHLGIGGAEQGCIDVAAQLVKAGHKSLVMSHGGSRIQELTSNGSVHISHPVDTKNPIKIWQNIRFIKSIIKKHEVDIVHVRSRAPAWSAYFACRTSSTVFITTVHSTYSGNQNPIKRLYNSVMSMGDHVIAVSNTIADYIQHHFQTDPNKVSIIPRGIDIDHFSRTRIKDCHIDSLRNKWDLCASKKIILLPGRVTWRKGHTIAIKALAQLSHINAHLVIVGPIQKNSRYKERLDRLIKHHKLEEHVTFTGPYSDMPVAYALSKLVLTPSLTPEAFGRTAVESQAMGVAVIASKMGEYTYTIQQNKTGWLVPVGNASTLAAKIEEALTIDLDEQVNMSINAIKNVHENYTREQMFNKTLCVYEDILNTSKKNGNLASDQL